MFFSQDRTQMRKVYFNSWEKYKQQLPLEPMESIIATLIARHPEYHSFFDTPESSQNKDFTPEMGQTNPFLHLGMHIAIQEHVSTNRPPEINLLYQSLCDKFGDQHEAEHQIMECLAEMLWEAQNKNSQPDENAYMECIRKLV